MYVLYGQHQDGYHNVRDLITTVIYSASIVVLFVLTCFADQRPTKRHVHIQDESDDIRRPLLARSDLDLDAEEQEPEIDDSAVQECPAQRASFLSLMTFWWVNGLTITGYRKSLTLSDLWPLNPEDTTKHIAPRFDQNWSKNKSPAKHFQYGTFASTEQNYSYDPTVSRKAPGIGITLLKTYKYELMNSALSEFLLSTIEFVNPQLLK